MKAWFAALLALIAFPAGAQEARVKDKTVRADVFPETHARFPRGVVAVPQVEVANLTGFRPVRIDLYLPRHRSATRPAVLWIHGGGWSRGDARTSAAFADWPAVLASHAARGYVVASLDYRLNGEARFPAQVQDVKSAILHLRANAARYGIDPERVYLWGGSAGAHLAALAATSCGAPEFMPEPSTGRLERAEMQAAFAARPPAGGDCVQGVAAWYGPFDLAELRAVNVAALLGCDPDVCADKARAASPLHRVDASTPPMLLLHGAADTTVPASQSRAMAERLRAAGVQVEFELIPGVDHGWLGSTPAQTREASLSALRRSFAFFHSLSRR